MNTNEKQFASVSWNVLDILTIEGVTRRTALKFLEKNRVQLQDIMLEAGWKFITEEINKPSLSPLSDYLRDNFDKVKDIPVTPTDPLTMRGLPECS